ncbi:MAG TPA: alpha/beta fold hydrolase [Bacteroidia bacterium]|nr:alpha/beta fold hydrolase [Bacteroidia bacterium]
MKLFFRKYGKGKPVIILHGLFGMSDNWMTMAKRLAEHSLHVIVPDMRNHGQSPHSEEWDYESMSADVFELMDTYKIGAPVIIGHSMGAKVAMQMAAQHPKKISALIIVDMAPKAYPVLHASILSVLNELNRSTPFTRNKAEQLLFRRIHDAATVKFLLKNLYWKTDTKGGIALAFRFNLKVITAKIKNMGNEISFPHTIKIPSLFVRGEKSDYLSEGDLAAIKKKFPKAKLVTVDNAGHWVHAENPDGFLSEILRLLKPHK